MRERLMMSGRMGSAGMLAAGVANEINNPLAVVIGNLDFTGSPLARVVQEAGSLRAHEFAADPGRWLAERLSEVEEPLSDMREALQRIRDIVRDVKLFSRQATRPGVRWTYDAPSTRRAGWPKTRSGIVRAWSKTTARCPRSTRTSRTSGKSSSISS